MPQKMPQKILPTKQPGAKSGRIELRRYNWFRRCAMLQKRCAMLHTPAEFQLKWSQILLRPNHPNLHLLKHIFYLFLFIYFFVRLSELANTQLDVALSRSSFFWYIMQWHTALPMFALVMSIYPSTHITQHGTCCEHWTLAMSWMWPGPCGLQAPSLVGDLLHIFLRHFETRK
jgi:hypothetical protein